MIEEVRRVEAAESVSPRGEGERRPSSAAWTARTWNGPPGWSSTESSHPWSPRSTRSPTPRPPSPPSRTVTRRAKSSSRWR